MEVRPGVWVPLLALSTQPVLQDLSVRQRKKTNSRRTISITINWRSASLQRHKPTENLKALAKVLTNRVDTVLE